MTNILPAFNADELNQILAAQQRTVEILKKRFPNLTVLEANMIAKDILMAITSVTQ